MTKRILLPMLCVFVTASVFAQGQGLAGINEATSMMTSYFDPATKLCYAIGPFWDWWAESRLTASSVAETPTPARRLPAGFSRVSF